MGSIKIALMTIICSTVSSQLTEHIFLKYLLTTEYHANMLLRNLSPNEGHANSARYIIEEINDDAMHSKLVIGACTGEGSLCPV